jgi:hypothetical protein
LLCSGLQGEAAAPARAVSAVSLTRPPSRASSRRSAASTASNSERIPNETSLTFPSTKNVGVARTPLSRPLCDVLADALQIDVIVHLEIVARHVELQPLRVGPELRELQVRLVVEEQIVHRPEPLLRARAFGGLGSRQRVRMNLLEREIAEREPDAPLEMLEQHLHRGGRLLAVRALEVAVFDDA